MSDRCRLRYTEAISTYKVAIGLYGAADFGTRPKKIAFFDDLTAAAGPLEIIDVAGVNMEYGLAGLASDGVNLFVGNRATPYTTKHTLAGALLASTDTAGGSEYEITGRSGYVFQIRWNGTAYVIADLSTSSLGVLRNFAPAGITNNSQIYCSPTKLWHVDSSASANLTSFDLATGTQGATYNLKTIAALGVDIYASGLAVSDDGRFAVVPHGSKLYIFDLNGSSLWTYLPSTGHSIESGKQSPCGMVGNEFVATSYQRALLTMNVLNDSALTVKWADLNVLPGYTGGYNVGLHPMCLIPL